MYVGERRFTDFKSDARTPLADFFRILLDGHPTTLYGVGTTAPGGNRETFYQWIATDINFPLKLVKQNGGWMVEYRHVKLRPVADVFFQRLQHYVPLDEDHSVPVPTIPADLP